MLKGLLFLLEHILFTGAIQQHFSFLKDSAGISVDEMNSIALETTAFNQTEFEMVQNQRNSILKVEAFLKRLIRKGNIYCELFLSGLNRKGHAHIVQVLSQSQSKLTKVLNKRC